MASFFSGFDVVKKNAFGITYKIPNQTIHVWKVEADGTLTQLTDLAPASGTSSLTSDSFGVVHGGQLNAVAPGTKLRFARPGETASDDPHVLRTTTTLQLEIAIETDLTLLLDDLFVADPDEIAYIQIFMRSGPNADPVLIGTVAPGETLSLPYNPAQDSEIQFFAISWSAAGVAHTFDLTAAPSVTITPNRETLTPGINQSGTATNTAVDINITNFSTLATFRKIEIANNSSFTNSQMIVLDAVNLGGVLPTTYHYTKTGESAAVHRYFRVAHSSNGIMYTAWSNVLDVTFASSGGSGGSGGGTPPTLTSASWDGNVTVTITWTPNGGAGQYTLENRSRFWIEFLHRWSSWTIWQTVNSAISSAATSTTDTQLQDETDRQVQYRVSRNDIAGTSNVGEVYIDGTG